MKKNYYMCIVLLVITFVVSVILWNFPHPISHESGGDTTFLYAPPPKKPKDPPPPPRIPSKYTKYDPKYKQKTIKGFLPSGNSVSAIANQINKGKDVKNEAYAKKLFETGYLFVGDKKDGKGNVIKGADGKPVQQVYTRQDDKNHKVSGGAGTNTGMAINHVPEKNAPNKKDLEKVPGTGTFYDPSSGTLWAQGKDGLRGIKYKEIPGKNGDPPRFVDNNGNPLPKNVSKYLVDAAGVGSGQMAQAQGVVNNTSMAVGKKVTLSSSDISKLNKIDGTQTYLADNGTLYVKGANNSYYGVKYEWKTVNGKLGYYDDNNKQLPKNVQAAIAVQKPAGSSSSGQGDANPSQQASSSYPGSNVSFNGKPLSGAAIPGANPIPIPGGSSSGSPPPNKPPKPANNAPPPGGVGNFNQAFGVYIPPGAQPFKDGQFKGSVDSSTGKIFGGDGKEVPVQRPGNGQFTYTLNGVTSPMPSDLLKHLLSTPGYQNSINHGGMDLQAYNDSWGRAQNHPMGNGTYRDTKNKNVFDSYGNLIAN